jgi:biopolymer transport protein ExbD
MRRSWLRRNNDRSASAREVMGIAMSDTYLNLFLIALLLIGPHAELLKLHGSNRAQSQKEADVSIIVTASNGLSIAGYGPVALEKLADVLRARGDKQSVHVHVERNVAIEREHAVLKTVRATGAPSISLSLLEGK